MQTINNTARVRDGEIELDNGWRVNFTYGAAIVRKPVDVASGNADRDAVVAIFSDAEEGIAWASTGGTGDSVNGIRFKPS